MTQLFNPLIGALMRIYRAAPGYPYPLVSIFLARILSVFVNLRRDPIVVKNVDGTIFELDLREVIDSSLYFSGTFELETERAMSTFVKKGMIVLDIGANFGYHTFRMARAVQAEGNVIAIEPSEWALSKLERNLQLNKVSNVRTLKIGLSDSDEGMAESSFRASYRLDGSIPNATEMVEIMTLDTLLARERIERVDFIKLDVDGFEEKVLKGSEKTLETCSPIVLFEVSPFILGEAACQRLGELLTRLGYAFQSDAGEPIDDIMATWSRLPYGASANYVALPVD